MGDTRPWRQERESAAKKRKSGCGAGRVSAKRRRRRPPWSRSSRRHREGFLRGEKRTFQKVGKGGAGEQQPCSPYPCEAPTPPSPTDEGQGECAGHAVLRAPREQQVSEGTHSKGRFGLHGQVLQQHLTCRCGQSRSGWELVSKMAVGWARQASGSPKGKGANNPGARKRGMTEGPGGMGSGH